MDVPSFLQYQQHPKISAATCSTIVSIAVKIVATQTEIIQSLDTKRRLFDRSAWCIEH